MIIPPPPRSTLFPYTTLFRSLCSVRGFASGIKIDGKPEIDTAWRTRINVLGMRVCSLHHERWRANRKHEVRSEEHTSELQSRRDLVCRLLLEKKNTLNLYVYL